MVCFPSILCGEASSNRLPGIIPAGYDSHTGYQYDSISLVAGHRELAPPSKFSKLGGFNNKVFITSGILHPSVCMLRLSQLNSLESVVCPALRTGLPTLIPHTNCTATYTRPQTTIRTELRTLIRRWGRG